MSAVPEKTSTRPSGLILIQACDGSPFWFMPVGYSIAEMPRPLCTAISEPPGFRAGRRGARAATRPSEARSSRCGSRPTARARARPRPPGWWESSTDRCRRSRSATCRRSRLAFLSLISNGSRPSSQRDPAHVRLDRERDGRDAEPAHRRRRHAVREDDVAVELEVRDRVGAGVVEAVLRQAVRREARVGARVVQRQHLAAEDPAVLRDRVRDLHVPRRPRRGAEELLLARPAPLHRPARLEREQRAHRLRRGVHLAAEAAADRAADELELVQRHLQVRGDDAHREVERLRAGVDRQAAVGLGHDLAHLRLERDVLDRGGAVDALHDHVRLLERLVDRALADLAPVHLAFEVRVPVAPVVHLRRVRVERLADVEERRLLRRARGRSPRRRPARSPRPPPRRPRSAGPCSGRCPSRAAARRPGCRGPRGARTRAAARPSR